MTNKNVTDTTGKILSGETKPGKFRKGHDPRRNLKGRPPGITALTEARQHVSELLNEPVADKPDTTAFSAIVHRAITDALQGDARAREWLAEYAYGKLPTSSAVEISGHALTLADISERARRFREASGRVDAAEGGRPPE